MTDERDTIITEYEKLLDNYKRRNSWLEHENAELRCSNAQLEIMSTCWEELAKTGYTDIICEFIDWKFNVKSKNSVSKNNISP